MNHVFYDDMSWAATARAYRGLGSLGGGGRRSIDTTRIAPASPHGLLGSRRQVA
jgi:hypothetical protein